MARLSNTATKAERDEAHQAKLAGKRYDRARRAGTPQTAFERAAAKRPAGLFNRMAQLNRHTLDPHTNAREIERRTRQAGA